jgi:serine/threonine protein kinase
MERKDIKELEAKALEAKEMAKQFEEMGRVDKAWEALQLCLVYSKQAMALTNELNEPGNTFSSSGSVAKGSDMEKGKQRASTIGAKSSQCLVNDRYQHYNPKVLLGRGAFGKVYKVKDTKTNKDVALKWLVADSPKMANQFLEEATKLIYIQHENILPCYSVFLALDEDDFVIGIAMELASQGNLTSFITKLKMKSEQQRTKLTWKVLADITAGLKRLHGEKLVHRDLKPDNILISGSDDHPTAKLADFGLVRSLHEGTAHTNAGTPFFMAPEQGRRGYDEKVDIFALGIIFTMVLVGEDDFLRSDLPMNWVQRDPSSFFASIQKALQKNGYGQWGALVVSMLQLQPLARPSCLQVLAQVHALSPRSAGASLSSSAVGRYSSSFEKLGNNSSVLISDVDGRLHTTVVERMCSKVSYNDFQNVYSPVGQTVAKSRLDSSSHSSVQCSSPLEVFRNNKNREFTWEDIIGHIVEVSGDQRGSRFLQHKLEEASLAEKQLVFQEILPSALHLMTDVFGNYVIQKFFEKGTPEQITLLGDKLTGNVVVLSMHQYGCRVVQKALEFISLEQQEKVVNELQRDIMKCINCQNGNHVIQKCIQELPANILQPIIKKFYGQAFYLATHRYGCRIIQRILEYCTEQQKAPILEELLQYTGRLVQDQYGNYVIQYVLEYGKPVDKSSVIQKFKWQILEFSQHRFASNVVEKCFQHANEAERAMLIDEILQPRSDGTRALEIMIKDQYANYVVQKVLDIVSDRQRELLIAHIKPHIPELKEYPFGKLIIARMKQ